jgi:flagellar protein FliS
MTHGYMRQAHAMYQQTRVQGGVEGADRHRLTAMLFDGAIERINQACGHVRRGDVAGKGEAISRAVAIVGQLRSDLDHQAGGELSGRLDALYEYVTRRLLHGQLHDDVAALEECVRVLVPLRDGWAGIRESYLASARAQ